VLQIRDLRPDVRVVADLDNPSVAHALEGVLSSVGVLDVAALFAPAVVETCLARRARQIELGGTEFVGRHLVDVHLVAHQQQPVGLDGAAEMADGVTG